MIGRTVILFLHHRYRAPGGEERVVEDLARLVREELDEPVEVLERRSQTTGRARAALGVVAGGIEPGEVARAVRRTRARVVHAHNLHPTFGWRALAAAREAGAGVVLHLHQYRLVCAIGICHRDGHDCTRCHGRNTAPGILLNCRGSVPEALAYGAGLALWQRRTTGAADACIVPSRFARDRLAAIGAPVRDPVVLPHPVWPSPSLDAEPGVADPDLPPGRWALLAARLVPEKGIEVALRACALARLPLLIAGEGPERDRLEAAHPPPAARFLGRLDLPRLTQLRRAAAIELVPSLTGESFGLAAAEAMAAGLPVAGSQVGALPELVPEDWLVAPGDPGSLAAAIARILATAGAGAHARQIAEALTSPRTIAPRLADVYEEAVARRAAAGGGSG